MNRQLSAETPYAIDYDDIYTYYLDSFTTLSHSSGEPFQDTIFMRGSSGQLLSKAPVRASQLTAMIWF